MRAVTLILRAILAGSAPLAATGALAAEDGPAFAAIFDVCEAPTLDEAALRGGRLGWPAAPEDRSWRASFERDNGGTVRIVSWRQDAREGDALLSYRVWVSSELNVHVTCTVQTDRPGLLGAVRDRFGAPDTFETFEAQGAVVIAFWRRANREIYFNQVGATGLVNLLRRF